MKRVDVVDSKKGGRSPGVRGYRMSRSRAVGSAVAALGLLVATFSACGSSSKGSAPPQSSASTGSAGSSGAASSANTSCPSAPGVTPTQVKVGLSTDLTGANAAQEGIFVPAAKAAFSAANAAGGIDGRKIVDVVADNASNPAGSAALARGLVESNGVFAIVNGSSASATMWPYIVQADIPEFDALPEAPAFGTAPNLFTATGAFVPKQPTSTAWGKFLKDMGVTSIALFSSTSTSGRLGAASDAAEFASLGMKVVYENNAVPFSAFDATSIALRLKQLKPDAVMLPLGEPEANSIIHSDNEQGFTPKVTLQVTAYDPITFTAGVAGTYVSTNWAPYLGPIAQLPPAGQAFRNAMAKYAPTTRLGDYAAEGWATGSLFLHALAIGGAVPHPGLHRVQYA